MQCYNNYSKDKQNDIYMHELFELFCVMVPRKLNSQINVSVCWQLKFDILKCKHIHANRLLGLIRRSFDHLDSNMLNCLHPWYVLHWNTVIQYGGHHLYWIKGRLRGYSAELQNFCHILKTSHMKRDYQYYNYHPQLTDTTEVI